MMSTTLSSPTAMNHPTAISQQVSCKTFNSALPIYSFDWSPHRTHFCSLAVGSFVAANGDGGEGSCGNCVQLASLTDPEAMDFQSTSPHPPIQLQYPTTKVQFSSHRSGDDELLGVSGDGLKIFRIKDDFSSSLVAKLVPAQISTSPSSSTAASRRPSDANIITSAANINTTTNPNVLGPRNSPAPITAFDWNRVDPNLLVTSSYDTTCAVWNLSTGTVKTQLIAHDKEVFDVAFNPKSADIFASVGAEGSVRLFDTRSLDHSTILYETADAQPLLRLAWNPLDNNYLACFGLDGQQVVLVDVRSAAVPVAVLSGHQGVSAIRWAPHNSGWLMVAEAASTYGGALKLWDVSQNVLQPSFHLPQAAAVQNVVWPVNAPDWLAFSTSAQQIHVIKL